MFLINIENTLWALITPALNRRYFLRVALIKAAVRGAGVIRAILEREYHVFEKLSFIEIWYIASLVCTLSFYLIL